MESVLENHEVQRLQDRIAELEAALSDARQDLRITRAWIRLACRAGSAAGGACETPGVVTHLAGTAAST